MVKLVIPVPTCDIPERVNGQVCLFRVSYVFGQDRDYSGRIGSVSCLFRSLKDRLLRDRKIACVQVFLPSGRCLCECHRF